MRRLTNIALLLTFISLGFGSTAAAQVEIGIRIGAPPAPRVLRVLPPRPAPDYIWIDGYWFPVGGRYTWRDGYWTLPPNPGAKWMKPRYDGQRFFSGYWKDDRQVPGRGRARGRGRG